jgi:hypothetical protein
VVAPGQSPPGSGVLDTPANLNSDLELGGKRGDDADLVEEEVVYTPTTPDAQEHSVPNKEKK